MLNTKKFIEKSIIKHGNKFIYNKVNYINSKLKVIISCKIHGDFEQMPNNHLSGQGCSKCSGKYKPNLTEFIEKCVKIHGNKYFYNKVNYINNYSKIILECPLHGDFSQTPNNHLMGQGCLKCSGNHKMSNLEFIKMSNDIHLNKYLYEKVNYTNCETKVEITCKKHGSFNQTPYRHLKGDGC